MVEILAGFSGEQSWDDLIAANTELFRQADLLDEAAYKIIEGDPFTADAWTKFSEAKALADAAVGALDMHMSPCVWERFQCWQHFT